MHWNRTSPRDGRTDVRPALEALETRLVPYALTGYSWPSPQLVTLSLVPDGTFIMGSNNGPLYSNLYASMANFWQGSGLGWQDTILKAAQGWAAQTNLNFSFVSDNGTAFEHGSYQQGDPGMGDVRIGAIDLGPASGGTVTYGQAFYPPSYTGDSAEGDIQFNNEFRFGNGTGITDVWSLASHEIGHALGLDHSSVSILSVMWPTYSLHMKLSSDDVAGIQAIYGGPRHPDSYESAGQGVSFATAVDVSSQINPTALTAVVTGLDNTTATDAGYYTFTAPAGSAPTATVTVQSSGLSLLAPVLTVYAADQTTVLGTAKATVETGATLSVTLSNVTPGSKYYVKVSGNASVGNTRLTYGVGGAQMTGVFAVGAYALTLNLGTGPAPVVPLPNTQLGLGTNWMGEPATPEVGHTQADGFTNTGEESPHSSPAGAAVPSTAGVAASLALPAGAAAVTQAGATPAAAAGVSAPAPATALVPPVRPTLTSYLPGAAARLEDVAGPEADGVTPAAAPAAPADEAPADPAVRPAAGAAVTAPALGIPAATAVIHPADAVFAGSDAVPAAPVLETGAPAATDNGFGARDHVLMAATLGLAWAYLPCRTPRRGERRPEELVAADAAE